MHAGAPFLQRLAAQRRSAGCGAGIVAPAPANGPYANERHGAAAYQREEKAGGEAGRVVGELDGVAAGRDGDGTHAFVERGRYRNLAAVHAGLPAFVVGYGEQQGGVARGRVYATGVAVFKHVGDKLCLRKAVMDAGELVHIKRVEQAARASGDGAALIERVDVYGMGCGALHNLAVDLAHVVGETPAFLYEGASVDTE